MGVLKATETAHGTGSSDYDQTRQYVPYFFAGDALEYFQQHYDAQVLTQEQSYLQDPKKFSHAGRLKSLPWRLAILLHSWQCACNSVQQEQFRWSRQLSRRSVEVAKTVFDYLSLQSTLLAANTDLLSALRAHNLRDEAAQRYPFLLIPGSSSAAPGGAPMLPDSAFEPWWGALGPENRIYATAAAYWLLNCTTTIVVDQGTVLRRLHSKDDGKPLEKEVAKSHTRNAFSLLHYAQLGVYRKQSTCHRLRKRRAPAEAQHALAFRNLLHFFRHKHAGDVEQYRAQCLQLTDSVRKQFKADADAPEPALPDLSHMEAVLQSLQQYSDEAAPFELLGKILNFKVRGGSSGQHSGLLYPATLDVLPALVLAQQHAAGSCRGRFAAEMLRAAYPAVRLTAADCNFIAGKLVRHAPHLLGTGLVLPTDVPAEEFAPDVSQCVRCNSLLAVLHMRVVPCFTSASQCKLVQLKYLRCVGCRAAYHGPWVEPVRPKNHGGGKFLSALPPAVFNTTPNLLFTASMLDSVTDILLHCGGSFHGIAELLPLPAGLKRRSVERLLRDTWLQHSVCRSLGQAGLHVDWSVQQNRMEAWCRGIQPLVTQRFQTRWLHEHQCAKCERGILGIDGNAKLRTKLCANTHDGVWECPLLQAHCLTGCQNAPIPGKKYCGLHLMDSDPVLGSDALMRHIILALDGARQHVILQSCAASCRRVWRAIKFAFIHAKGQYPVKLIKVTRVARARAYTFATSSGETFTLRGNDVPVRFQEEFGRRLLEPESRECQVKPRVGRLLQFSSRSQSMSCRAQWQRAQKARRSGGVLAAVKECQVVAALKLVYTHESPTGVYFFLAELLGSFAERECVDLKMLSRKQRLCIF